MLELLADRPYDGVVLARELGLFAGRMDVIAAQQVPLQAACRELVEILDTLPGTTLQERWTVFEWEVWPRWIRGEGAGPNTAGRWASAR